MPIYEYACSACGHRTDIVHGINDDGPQFCPSCGADGTMRKAFAAPAILFKGSGWAKKDRSSTSTPASKSSADTTASTSTDKPSTTDAGGSTSSASTTSGPASSTSAD